MVCIENPEVTESLLSTSDVLAQHGEVDAQTPCASTAPVSEEAVGAGTIQQGTLERSNSTGNGGDLSSLGDTFLVKPSTGEIPPSLKLFASKEFVSFLQEKSDSDPPQTKRSTLSRAPVSLHDAFVEFVRKRLPLLIGDSAVHDLLQFIPSSPSDVSGEDITSYLPNKVDSGLLSCQHSRMPPSSSISNETVVGIQEVSKELKHVLSAFHFLSTNTTACSLFDFIAVASNAITALESTAECILRIMEDAFRSSKNTGSTVPKAHELFYLREFLRTRSPDDANDMLGLLRRWDEGRTTRATKPKTEGDNGSTAGSTSASLECLAPAHVEKGSLKTGVPKPETEARQITSYQEPATHTALSSAALSGLLIDENSIRDYVSKRLPNENAIVDWSLFNQMVQGNVNTPVAEAFGLAEQSCQATLPSNIPSVPFSAVTEMRNAFQDAIPTTFHPAFSQLPAFARLGKQHVQAVPAVTSPAHSTTPEACARNKEAHFSAPVSAAQALNIAAEESRRRVAAAEARAMQGTNIGQRGRLAQWESSSLVARNSGLASHTESLDRSRSFDMAIMRRNCRDPSVAGIDARGPFCETQKPAQEVPQYQVSYPSHAGMAGVTQHLHRISSQRWRHGPQENTLCEHRQPLPVTLYGSKNSSPRSYDVRPSLPPTVHTSTSMVALPEVHGQRAAFGRPQMTSHQAPHVSQMLQPPCVTSMPHMPSAPPIVGGNGEGTAPAPIIDIQTLKRHQYTSEHVSAHGLRQPTESQQNRAPNVVDPYQHSLPSAIQRQAFMTPFYPRGRSGPQQPPLTSAQPMQAYPRFPYDSSTVVIPQGYGITHPSRSMPLGGSQNHRLNREDAAGQILGHHTYCQIPTAFMSQQCSQKASNGFQIHQQLVSPPQNTMWKQQNVYSGNKNILAESRLYADTDGNASQNFRQPPPAVAAVGSKHMWGYSS